MYKANNIRMLFKVTYSELNMVLWSTHFTLPNIFTHMGDIQISRSMGDINIGELFLNFMMHKSLREFLKWALLTYLLRTPNWKTGSIKYKVSGNYGAGI